LFLLAPVVAFGPALAAWAVIPFGDGMMISHLDAGILYLLALTSMGVYGVIIAGWALRIQNMPSSARCARRLRSCPMRSPWASRWWAC